MATQDVTLEDFLDLAGHELRKPVAALKLQIQMMQRRWRRQGTAPEQLCDLDRILYHTDRINYQLQVLLDTFHVAKGDLPMMPTEAENDLGELITRLLTSGSAANPGHSIHFQPSTDDAPIVGNWDRMRLETVMSILLANAFMYSAGGEILVTLTREEERARIEVSDHGIGVPAEDRASIFQRRTYGSNVTNGGMGLGLYVASEIVKAHGGQIGVRPREGGGSVFWFTLSLARFIPLSEQAAKASEVAEQHPSTTKKPVRARKPSQWKEMQPAPAHARTSTGGASPGEKKRARSPRASARRAPSAQS
jgi:signal transduction histidine kinase